MNTRRSRRRSSRGRGRTGITGVVMLVSAAALLGALAGFLLNLKETPHETPAPAVSEPSRPLESPKPAAEKPVAPPVSSPLSSPPAAARQSTEVAADTAAKSAEPAAAGTSRNTPQKPAAFPGEAAFIKDAGSMIALTFDAGAGAEPTADILEALSQAGLNVTFFLTGRWCEQNPELVKRIAGEGHEIANHTYSHKDLRKLSDEQIRKQLDDMSRVCERITGQPVAPYFRPPFGSRDARVLQAAAEAGYRSVYWSVDSWDAFKRGITADEVRRRVLDRAGAGDIVLMHCGSKATADALPDIIRELQRRGLEIVTVSRLLGR